jgi:hypothetical protein
MSKQKALKTKAPAVVAVPKPTNPTVAPSGQMLYTSRIRRIAEARTRGAVLKASLPEWLKGIEDDDITAVIGLIDLLKTRDCSNPTIGTSWLGGFIYDQLFEVAAEGVEARENEPNAVMECLRENIERFVSDLKDARELAGRYEEFDAIGVCA